MLKLRSYVFVILAALLLAAGIFFYADFSARAQDDALVIPNVPSENFTDGDFAPSLDDGATHVVDLNEAIDGEWNAASLGQGVYDDSRWAVVFKYTSVNVPAGVI